MILKHKINKAHLFEFIYFYYYIFKCFNIFIFYKTHFFFKINYFIKNYFFAALNPIPTIKTHFYIKQNVFIKNTNEIVNKKHIFLKYKQTNFFFKFINLFFLFNCSTFNRTFKIHHDNNLFFINSYNSFFINLNIKKLILKWKETYFFLYNIFFYKTEPLVFGSILFKNEILAINWNYKFFELNIWKHYFPFFIFKLNNYNKKNEYFFTKILEKKINFLLITDCLYHFKTLFYLNKKKIYSIGLIPANLNPWIVSYPIISFFENYISQFFFLKLLLFIQKETLYFHFLNNKLLWVNHSIFQNLK